MTSSLFTAMRSLYRAVGNFRWLALPCIRLCIPACINTRCWLVPDSRIVGIKRHGFCRAFLHLPASHLSDKASDILSDFCPQIPLAPKLGGGAVKSGRAPVTPPLLHARSNVRIAFSRPRITMSTMAAVCVCINVPIAELSSSQAGTFRLPALSRGLHFRSPIAALKRLSEALVR